jgi:hypothetical protein
MFEHHRQGLLPRSQFMRRQARFTLAALGIIVASLAIGMLGYHFFEGLAWMDAFLNAAMLMGGMGPLAPLTTDAGKLFAGLYALYCGLVLLISVGILAAPIFHRFLHRFHIELDDVTTQPSLRGTKQSPLIGPEIASQTALAMTQAEQLLDDKDS